MFRTLYESAPAPSKEPFLSQTQFIGDQTNRFTKQYPNMMLTTVAPEDIGSSLSGNDGAFITIDPNTRQGRGTLDLKDFTTSMQMSQELIQSGQRCKTATLDDLIGSVNPRDTQRCGWVLSRDGNPPRISAGALGTRSGPLDILDPPTGTWYWDLDAAKKEILRRKCNALVSCGNVGSSTYEGCAFSAERGIGLPVTRNKQLMYPEDPALSGGDLIFDAANCPPPPPPGSPQYEIQKSRDVCMPDENGNIPRNCMLDQIKLAGCKDNGALYDAIQNRAVPNNWAAGVTSLASFPRYQASAKVPLLTDLIKQGKGTMQIALDNFKQLAMAASEVRETADNYAARDLCLQKGLYQTFDFCTELMDNSPAPFALNCLQKQFRLQGGQPEGVMYPSPQTAQFWNQFQTWSAVKSTISQMAAQTRSGSPDVQREALKNFLGIVREKKGPSQIGRVQGVEVLWYDREVNAIMGRQFIPRLPNFQYQPGQNVEPLKKENFIQFYSVVNIRPPQDMTIRLRTETDDGMIVALNQEVNPDLGYADKSVDTGSIFSRWFITPPATFTNSQCWSLKAGGPNYFFIRYYEHGGHAFFKLLYSDCNGQSYAEIPTDWLTLTQEPDAPMLAFEGMVDENDTPVAFRDFRFGQNFQLSFNGVGGSNPPIGTTLVKSTTFPGLKSALAFRGNTAFAGMSAPLYANAWRTMSFAFTVDQLPGAGQIYPFYKGGPLTVVIEGSGSSTVNVKLIYSSATLNTTKVFTGLPVQTPLYLIMNMRSDFANRYPNRLVAMVGTLSSVASGQSRLGSTGPNNLSVSAPGNAALYTPRDTYQAYLGMWSYGVQYPVNTTTQFTVGWWRLFDYELDAEDIQRDASNAWIRAYVGQTSVNVGS